jgi:hypothetical protein
MSWERVERRVKELRVKKQELSVRLCEKRDEQEEEEEGEEHSP